MMVEAGANELPEDVILDAILYGHQEIQRIVAFQEEIQQACGKEKRESKLFKVLTLRCSSVGLMTNSSFTRPTRTPAIGPIKGISEMQSAAEAPIMAASYGALSCSTDITVATICTSLR